MQLNYGKIVYEVMSFKSDIPGTLAHWSYTTDEWRAFMNWKNKRKGVIYHLLYLAGLQRNNKVQEVIITKDYAVIDNKQEFFINAERHLKRVNIKDVGAYNIMEIMYESKDTSTGLIHEVYIPVPKGKLKEAIRVQEELLNEMNSREVFS